MGYDELDNKRFEGQSIFIGLVLGAFGNIVVEDLKYMAGLEGTGVCIWLFRIIAWCTLIGAFSILFNFKIGKDWKTRRQSKKRRGVRTHRAGFILRLRNDLYID